MPRAARLAVAVLSCGAGLVAGCGGGGASGDDGPASAVPRDAALYVEATVRPAGELREDALAAAGKVLHTSDPERRIEALVQEAFAGAEEPKLDYARDVKPWLGEQAGFWLAASGAGEEARGVAVVAAEDPEQAQEAIDRAVQGSDRRFTRRSHAGVEYQVNEDGGAAAVVEDFAVLGTEAELKRTIDAVEGESLAEDDRYEAAIEDLEDDRLAHFYLDGKALVDQALRRDPAAAEQLEQFRSVFPIDRLGPITGSFSADGERLLVDTMTSAQGAEAIRSFGGLLRSTPLLGELPGDSWGALGWADLGPTARDLYNRVAGALGGAAIAQQLRQELGLDLERDVFGWIGDAAFFARGTSEDAVDGGVVIEVTDEDRATAAFGKLVGVLRTRAGVDAQPTRVPGAEVAFEARIPDAPKPVVMARSAERVVIANGADAAADAFAPPERLADGEEYGEAGDRLGEGFEPSFLLSMPAVVTLAQSASASDPDWQEAKPYLEAFSVLSAGTRVEDDRARGRFVAGLK